MFLSLNGFAQNKAIPFGDLDFRKDGLVYFKNQLFTGKGYQLANNKKDTLGIQSFNSGLEDGYLIQYSVKNPKFIILKRYFRNGQKEGIHYAYFDNGAPKFLYQFKKGAYQGTQREWFDNGQMAQKMHYLNGREEGMIQVWDRSGKLIINYYYKNGRNYGNIGKKNCRSAWHNR